MSWMVPASKLDPDQRRFLDQLATDRAKKNYWIKGYVGSGKSVLLVEALRQMKQDNPGLSMCVVLFTHSLIDMISTGIGSEVTGVPVMTYFEFKKKPRHYDVILVDEVQDLPREIVELLTRHAGQLIVAGDEKQSIYDKRIKPSEITTVANAEAFPLGIIHRLTQRVIEIIQNIAPSKRLEDARRQKLASVDVKLGIAEVDEEEAKYVWKTAGLHASAGSPSAILLPTHDDIIGFVNQVLRLEGHDAWKPTFNRYRKPNYRSLNQYLKQLGLNLRYLGNQYGSLKSADSNSRVFMMTYHSSKGLDFETVFLPRLNDSLDVWDDEERAKTLFFVAITRSRRDLYLTYAGEPHKYVQRIPDALVHKITIPEPQAEEQDEEDIGVIF